MIKFQQPNNTLMSKIAKLNQKKYDNNNKIKKFKNDFLNNLGFYIPYSLINSDWTYEYIEERSLMAKNIDRDTNYGTNIFSWVNKLDNKVKNLIYIYVHFCTIPLHPWLNKNIVHDFYSDVKDYIINQLHFGHLNTDDIFNIISPNASSIQICYADDDFIDFVLNYDYTRLYSLIISSSVIYLYTRPERRIDDQGLLYLEIDTNNNLNNNTSYNTSKQLKKFTFKLTPLTITDNNVYYKSTGQYLQKTLNDIISFNSLTIKIYDATYKLLNNDNINKKLYSKKIVFDDIDNPKPSNYNNYIRHPLNQYNQVDISFKIGQISNEIITNIFN